MIFVITPMDPEHYRAKTRLSTFAIAGLFLLLGLGISSVLVQLFGEPGGDNLRWNIGGVLVGLAVTVALVRWVFWQQPWMAPAVYGWRLKRTLMRVTNVMHHVKAGVAAQQPVAMAVLRFYHLGLTQMHQLDGDSSSLSQAVPEINKHFEAMQALGLDTEQTRFEPGWLAEMKAIPASR